MEIQLTVDSAANQSYSIKGLHFSRQTQLDWDDYGFSLERTQKQIHEICAGKETARVYGLTWTQAAVEQSDLKQGFVTGRGCSQHGGVTYLQHLYLSSSHPFYLPPFSLLFFIILCYN